jgi:hypothetical protein
MLSILRRTGDHDHPKATATQAYAMAQIGHDRDGALHWSTSRSI